jgi:hypothetical protein
MPTTEEMAIRRDIQARLQRDGIAIDFLRDWPAKATYYKPSGEAMPNLPADAYSMQRYLRRGFSLVPPKKTTSLVCDVCGAGPFGAPIGLTGHKRTHKKENKK